MPEDGGVRNNEARSRFEMLVDGATAVAQYKLEDGVMRFTHTIVPQEVEGRGIGSQLVKGALEEARSLGLKVDPVCPFVRNYIDKHPAYRDLLAA
jgi:hypothetical protein